MSYRVITSTIKGIDGRCHKVYGISKCKTRIEDISFDKRQVKQLAGLFNRLKLDQSHMQYAVEDYLLRNCNTNC